MKKRTPRMWISYALIAVGLLLIGLAAVYELTSYPWRTVFGGEDLQQDVLPDPTPPKVNDADIEVISPEQENFDSYFVGSDVDDVVVQMPAGDTLTNPNAQPAAPSSKESAPPASSPTSGSSSGSAAPAKPKYISFGAFKIPKLSVSVNLLEGSENEMRYGVGHLPGTAMPGALGNCVISGHRNYISMHPFRHLDKMVSGDRIIIKVGDNTYTYETFDSFVVAPEDVWVLRKVQDEPYLLTLITCTPVIRPTDRLIVRARLVDVNGAAPEVPQTPTPAVSPSPDPSPSAEDTATPDPSPTPDDVTSADVSPSAEDVSPVPSE